MFIIYLCHILQEDCVRDLIRLILLETLQQDLVGKSQGHQPPNHLAGARVVHSIPIYLTAYSVDALQIIKISSC